MCEESSRIAEERFAAGSGSWRNIAMENDVVRSTGNECTVPMKRYIMIGVEIIPCVCFYAEIVNCSEVPLQYRPELSTKLWKRISLERCKLAQNHNSMVLDLVFQIGN